MIKIANFLKKSELIVPSTTSGTMSLWHGGNLDHLDSFGNQKKGRYEYGSGLYLTTHYSTAQKYSKGSRRLYLVTIAKGNDGKEAKLPISTVKDFVKKTLSKKKQYNVLNAIDDHQRSGEISFDTFNNILINRDALKSSQTEVFRKFIVENGIDYISVSNAFGWGEMMIVLFNLKKIISTQVVKPKDNIENFNLPLNFN